MVATSQLFQTFDATEKSTEATPDLRLVQKTTTQIKSDLFTLQNRIHRLIPAVLLEPFMTAAFVRPNLQQFQSQSPAH